MQKKIFSPQELQTILQLYTEQHLSMAKIGEQFGVSKTVISRILKENNIQINKDNHKYIANYDYFEKIDSPEKAYWLGFIAADGCNFRRTENATISININSKDKEHLEKFKKALNSNCPIKDHIQTEGFSKNSKMSKITINSMKMSLDLEDKGVPPKKSLILEPPKIDKKYFLPYILGYFDGDGTIYKTNQYNNYGLHFPGTQKLVEWIKEQLELDGKIEKDKLYEIRCGGTVKPYNIMKKLYDSCDVHLDRKYQIFKDLETVVLTRNGKEYQVEN